jgi:hypothetical protein
VPLTYFRLLAGPWEYNGPLTGLGRHPVSSKVAELLRTAPDWARVDSQSAEVVAWLQRAHQAVKELDLVEVDIFGVHPSSSTTML